MPGRLDGLTALVTGGGGSCGTEIALGFAREGARVVVNDLGTDAWGRESGDPRAQRVVDQIRALGGEAIADCGDIGDFEQARGMVEKAIEAWGKLDILVNTAGTIRLGTIKEATPDDLQSLLHSHLIGYYNTSHHAAQHWVERGEYGRLINFSSSAGWWHSFPTLLAYAAAKAGNWGLTRACANALVAYNVTANAVNPNAAGPYMGDAMLHSQKQFEETGKWDSETAKGTSRDPVHIVPLVVFLASPQAAHVSSRLFMGQGGLYRMLSEIRSEREITVNFLEDPERTYRELEDSLTKGLSLRDLTAPLPPFEVLGEDWPETIGVDPPAWDFVTKPERAAR